MIYFYYKGWLQFQGRALNLVSKYQTWVDVGDSEEHTSLLHYTINYDAATLSIATLSIKTLSIMSLSIMTLSITTLRIMTFSITIC